MVWFGNGVLERRFVGEAAGAVGRPRIGIPAALAAAGRPAAALAALAALTAAVAAAAAAAVAAVTAGPGDLVDSTGAWLAINAWTLAIVAFELCFAVLIWNRLALFSRRLEVDLDHVSMRHPGCIGFTGVAWNANVIFRE